MGRCPAALTCRSIWRCSEARPRLPAGGLHQVVHEDERAHQADDQQSRHEQHEVEGDAPGQQGEAAQIIGETLGRQVVGVAPEILDGLRLVRRPRGPGTGRRPAVPAPQLLRRIRRSRRLRLARILAHQRGQRRADEAAARHGRQVVDVSKEAWRASACSRPRLNVAERMPPPEKQIPVRSLATPARRRKLPLPDQPVAGAPVADIVELVRKHLFPELSSGLRRRIGRPRRRPRGPGRDGLVARHAAFRLSTYLDIFSRPARVGQTRAARGRVQDTTRPAGHAAQGSESNADAAQ